MSEKFLLLLLFWLINLPAWAFDASRQTQTIAQLLMRVQAEAFPELAEVQVQLGFFEEDDAYFQSNFDFLSLWGAEPVYRVQMNPALLERNCPSEALEAILVHELSHTLDYVQGGLPGIAQIGWNYLFDDSRARYEHRTDLRAIFRGYGAGLIAYRHWIYAQLSSEQLQRKQRTYYQPAEIIQIEQILMGLRPEERLALESYWLADPPMDARAIAAGEGWLRGQRQP